MQSWTWEAGDNDGFCSWQGIKCKTINGIRYVNIVRIETRSGFTGLVGVLPPASVLLGLPGLTRLVIKEQLGITGPLRNDWSQLTTLKYLEEISLDYNSLNGTLPNSWGELKQLKVLGLQAQNTAVGGERLHGTLRLSWANLTKLERLRLGSNDLTGMLPASYGTIPVSWGKGLQRIQKLELYDNPDLQGCLPSEIQERLSRVGYDLDGKIYQGTRLKSC
eukprot:GHUV01044763.1.p1 GENE.GHUV01044763.1~~GHUV01044763.1.p1  ORF type:complete len:220 (+),score=5.39 GHUV01044763.1:1616-2275(+)